MIRQTLLFVIAFCLSHSITYGQFSYTYTGSSGESNVVNSVGLAINGDTVSIGTFTNFDPTLAGNATDLSALESHWANFDSTTTRTILGDDGRFAANSPAIGNPIFNNQKVYLWITEGTGNNITEYGLFSSSNPDWVFPTSTTINGITIDSNEVNQFLFGDGFSSGSPGSLTPGSLQTLALVPEPNAIALLGLGLLSWRLFLRSR